MIIREREWNKCKCCGNKTTLKTEEAYGCDKCGKEIDLQKKGEEYLDITIFRHDQETEHRQYCSWKCCLKDLKNIKTDHFISMPFLQYDSNKIHAREFFKLVKP